MAKKAGLRPIEMTRGAAAAGLNANTPDSEVIAAMADDPTLLQRPIVEFGDRAVVARPIEKALEILR